MQDFDEQESMHYASLGYDISRDIMQDPEVTRLQVRADRWRQELEYWREELEMCKKARLGEERIKHAEVNIKEAEDRYREAKEYFKKMTVKTGEEDPANHYMEVRRMKTEEEINGKS